MNRATVRLGRCLIPTLFALAGVCGAVSSATAQVSTAVPASAPAAKVSLEAQVEQFLRDVPKLTPAETIDRFGTLFQGDLSQVTATIRLSAYHAVATANERMAQQERAEQLDPAAERRAQGYIDAAVDAYVKAGRVDAFIKDYEGAEKDLGRALSYRPNNADALLALARVFAATGRQLQAIERYQDYFKASGRGALGTYEPELYVEVARTYLGAGLWNQARRNLDSAVKNNGDTDEVAALYSEVFIGLGQPLKAVEQVQKAIAKNPTQPAYHSKLAEMLISQRRYAEACQKAAQGIDVARQLLAAEPDNDKVLGLMNAGYATYAKALRMVLAGNPADVKTQLLLVDVLEKQADVLQLLSLHQALQQIRSAPERVRDDVQVVEQQVLLEKAVHHRELRLTCERLLRLQPGNAIATRILAELGAEKSPAPKPTAK